MEPHCGGDHVRGRALGEETLALARELGDRDQIAISLHNLARGALRDESYDDARALFAESLEIAVELGYRALIGTCLEAFAELSLADGELERAGRLIGAAGALLDELGVELGPEERAGRAAAVAELGRRLGSAALAELSAEGAALRLDDAVALGRES